METCRKTTELFVPRVPRQLSVAGSKLEENENSFILHAFVHVDLPLPGPRIVDGGKEVDFEGKDRCRQSESIAQCLHRRTGRCLAKDVVFVLYLYIYIYTVCTGEKAQAGSTGVCIVHFVSGVCVSLSLSRSLLLFPQGCLEQKILDSVVLFEGASMQWDSESEHQKVIVGKFEDSAGVSIQKFPTVADCLKWFVQIQAKKQKQNDPVP